jgi:putative ABC transport system permease protein
MTNWLGLSLALQDLRRGDVGLLYGALAFAGILTPLLLLMAMKTGLIEGLVSELKAQPDVLNIAFVGDYVIDKDELATIQSLPGVGFIAPSTRAIAARVELEGPQGDLHTTDLLPSDGPDPLLQGRTLKTNDIAVSARLAKHLKVKLGERVVVLLERSLVSGLQQTKMALTVAAIIPKDQASRKIAIVHAKFLDHIEAYRDGYNVPGFDGGGANLSNRKVDYASLRLYAADFEAVEFLDAALNSRGYVVISNAPKIREIERTDSLLSGAFNVVAVIGLSGAFLALALNLYANIERKRVSLSMLRLMGLDARQVALFPLVQAIAAVGVAYLIAVVSYLIVAYAINLSWDTTIAKLTLQQYGLAMAISLVGGCVAALAAARRAIVLEPVEALREQV